MIWLDYTRAEYDKAIISSIAICVFGTLLSNLEIMVTSKEVTPIRIGVICQFVNRFGFLTWQKKPAS
jgi:hypothetical protein